MRNFRIIGTGALGLITTFWVVAHPVEGLTVLALLPFLLILAGQLYFPRSKRALQVWFDPKVLLQLNDEENVELPVAQMRLNGLVIQANYFKQWHEFEVGPHRYWLLLLLGTVSLGSAFAVRKVDLGDLAFSGIGPFYFGGLLWSTVCIPTTWRWFQERRALRSSGLALGILDVRIRSRTGRYNIRYHFVDRDGEHHGGSFDSFFCDLSDDATIVFYDESQPDVSVPASALAFHKLAWRSGMVAASAR